MTLFFQFPNNGPFEKIDLEWPGTVEDLYVMVQDRSGIDKSYLLLTFCGTDLLDETKALNDYGISNFCVLHINGLYHL